MNDGIQSAHCTIQLNFKGIKELLIRHTKENKTRQNRVEYIRDQEKVHGNVYYVKFQKMMCQNKPHLQ